MKTVKKHLVARQYMSNIQVALAGVELIGYMKGTSRGYTLLWIASKVKDWGSLSLTRRQMRMCRYYMYTWFSEGASSVPQGQPRLVAWVQGQDYVARRKCVCERPACVIVR